MNYIESYLVVSSILFTFGIFAVITRKNAVAILMGIEIILNSANVNFIAFNRFGNFEVFNGHVLSIFVVFKILCSSNKIKKKTRGKIRILLFQLT